MDTAPSVFPMPAVCHPCQLGLDDQCQWSSSSATNYYHCWQHSSPSAKRQHTIFSANRVDIFLPANRNIFLSAKTDTFSSANREASPSSSSAINYHHCRQHNFLSTSRDIFLSANREPSPSSNVLCGTQPHIRDTARWQPCCALLFQPWSSVSVPNSCLLPVRCSYVTALLYMYLHCISASISLADILYFVYNHTGLWSTYMYCLAVQYMYVVYTVAVYNTVHT